MDQFEKKIIEKSFKSKRSWQNCEKTSFSTCGFGIKHKLKKSLKKTKKEGLTTKEILSLLSGSNNFLGVFAADKVPLIRDNYLPIFFIVNIDESFSPGSHWIAVRLDSRSLEIFDSLGFSSNRWKTFPNLLLDFFKRYNNSHSFRISPRLQSDNSYSCGLFCIYFCIARNTLSFTECLKNFTSDLQSNENVIRSKINSLYYFFFFSKIKIKWKVNMPECLRVKKTVKIFTRWIAKDRLYLGGLIMKRVIYFFFAVESFSSISR